MTDDVKQPESAIRAWAGKLINAWTNYRWRRGLLRGLREPGRYPERVRELRAMVDLPKDKLPMGWLWRVQALAEKALTRLPPDDPLVPDLKRIFHCALWTVQDRARSYD